MLKASRNSELQQKLGQKYICYAPVPGSSYRWSKFFPTPHISVCFVEVMCVALLFQQERHLLLASLPVSYQFCSCQSLKPQTGRIGFGELENAKTFIKYALESSTSGTIAKYQWLTFLHYTWKATFKPSQLKPLTVYENRTGTYSNQMKSIQFCDRKKQPTNEFEVHCCFCERFSTKISLLFL